MTPPREMVIGLEVHVQLATRSKMFCGCANDFGAAPNTRTCPVCLGRPGALPVPNRRAFELALRVGCALGARITQETGFDRKQYFYPDQPKGYQISQFDDPLLRDMRLPLDEARSVRIERAHLEEDAGKAMHDPKGAASWIDLNRCGIPLLEIVSAPDLRSPDEAVSYLQRLKLLLRHLGVSDCDMEKGSLRCDVNVSLRERGAEAFGTRVEIKNLNSFRSVAAALAFEGTRQGELLDRGAAVEHETRLWDEEREVTRSMRSKEESRDYRYFPDPDLPPYRVDDAWVQSVRESLPETPWARVARWREAHGVSDYDLEVLIQDPGSAECFDRVVAAGGDAKEAGKWITGEVFALVKASSVPLEASRLTPEALARVIALVADGTLNLASAKKVVSALFSEGGTADDIVERLGLSQLSDEAALNALLDAAVEALPKAAAELAAGKAKARGALIGKVMQETRGRADPAVLNRLIDARFPKG